MRGVALFVLLVLPALTACQDRTRTRKIVEPFTVVPGAAQVDTAAAKVLTDPRMDTGNFAINTPHQCDVFQQLSVRKVDILWVIDSSGSMAPKQARLAASFNGFINQLVSANPPIDFHIAVVTTDTDDPLTRGILRPWTLGALSGDYIGCVPQMPSGTLCNTSTTVAASTATAASAFNQIVGQVGIAGSAQERGLLAAYLALTNPANQATPASAKFIRPEAALYVIVVSDEDDSSCNPLVSQPVCTADPGCRCASDTSLAGPNAYGSTAYFTRFLETYKGYGNADLVALAAVVATDGDPDSGVPGQFGDLTQHIGCCTAASGAPCPKTGSNAALADSGMEVAYYGSRYLKVAADTGGVAVSICSGDSADAGTNDAGFSGALASLGYAASGLRKEFRLARGPDLRPMQGRATGVELYVSAPTAATCQVDGNCPSGLFCREGRCAKKLDVNLADTANQARYVKCDGTSLRNVIRFDGTSVPDSLSAIEVCYDVQATFQNSCP